MIAYKQLSLADIFSDCQEKFENDKPAFLSLLETHIDIDGDIGGWETLGSDTLKDK